MMSNHRVQVLLFILSFCFLSVFCLTSWFRSPLQDVPVSDSRIPAFQETIGNQNNSSSTESPTTFSNASNQHLNSSSEVIKASRNKRSGFDNNLRPPFSEGHSKPDNACTRYGNLCQHGSKCIPNGPKAQTPFECECTEGWTGAYCERDIDECVQSDGLICHNGGTCVNHNGSFNCVCVNGWTGPRCDDNIDDCAYATCFNGATCIDKVGSFRCQCPPGKTGLLCQFDDACASSPCKAKGATCDTSPVDGSYHCVCPPGYKGKDCTEDIDECQMNVVAKYMSYGSQYSSHAPNLSPCEHDGKCINTPGSFRCDCPRGFTGPRCETDINECDSNPCQNSGTCLDEKGFFKCLCMPGFTGATCQINIDECEPSPCANGGICRDIDNGFICTCPQGFAGPTCNENIDDCLSNPCLNGATCLDSLDSYTCKCLPGFNGPNCEVNINDCANSPCQNGGTCVDGINSYACHCPIGFTGKLCQNVINECNSSPCMFGGTCINLMNYDNRVGSNSTKVYRAPQLHSSILDGNGQGFRCECPAGTAGPRCEENLNDCYTNPCMNNGTCTDLVNGYRCTCPPGWTGPTCSFDVDECELGGGVCMNGATCVNKIGGFECLCPPGYFGRTCTKDRDDCLSNPCMNQGICRDHPGHGHFSCLCPAEFTGSRCESRFESIACNSNPCKHGGECKAHGDGFLCACKPGFTGSVCETNIDECSENPCLNGGVCLDGVNSFTCMCPLPFNGSRCESSLDPCLINSCSGRSKCVPSADLGSYTCLCDPGFTGSTCSEDINECATSVTGNWIRPTNYKDFLEKILQKETLCLNGGTCINNIGSYSCKCPKGFTGTRCEINIDECAPVRGGAPMCMNGGTCLDGVASFTCICPQGYGGNRCDIRIRSCASSPCFQGARCTDAPASQGQYQCHCPIGFSGKNCQYNDDDCTASSCLNGGTCVDGINTFTCQCPPGWTGRNCQFNEAKVPVGSEPKTLCQYFKVIPSHPGQRMRGGNEPLDCVKSDPWKNCPIADECFSLWGNGKCDSQCNTRACLFDGMDCDGVAPGSDPSEPSGRCNSLYEDYCLANYQNRYCDQGCNNKECGWDGLDCVNTTATTLPGQITFVFNTDFEILKNSNNIDIAQILRKLSFIIPGVVFEKQELKRDAETGKGALDLRVNQAHCDRGHECFKSVIEVEEFLEASQILRNSLSPEALQSHFKISDVRAVDPYYTQEGDDSPSGPPTTPTLGVIVSLSFVLIVCGVIIGVLTGNSGFGSFSGKIKKKRGITWFPEGFTRPTPTGRRDERRTGGAARAAGGDFSIRRGPHMGFPDAQEMHSLSSSTQLMTKESGQIHEQDVMDSDGYARKVATYDSIYDEPNEPRKWAIQHLEAYQGRCPAGQTQIMSPPLYDTLKARTPTTPTSVSSPFGSPGSPLGVGVDVRGPGGLTPLMVASAFDSQTLFCQQSMINGNHYPASPSALLMENNCSSDGQVNSPAPTQSDIIQELINSGASHVMQAELTGETPLHMAARYSRADAAKRLLEAGANPNTEDLKGRTPLHAAIAADARGVFEILLRHRATNLNAQDELGFTPLILAVKNSVEDMIEELIRAEANLDIQDAKGKTALHWAASVNNVSAINHLLNAGANKDAQDNLEQTPLFLAARDGAAQAVKLLLSKGANRDITDHMDKLPRDIAAELLHGDIVRALDEAVPQHSVMYGTSLYGQTMSPPQLPPVNHIRSISHDVDQKPKLANARLTQAKKAAQNRRPSCSSSSSDPTEAENAAKPPRSRHERGSSTLGRVKKSASSNHQRSHSAARATPASNNSNQAPVIPLQQLQPQQLSNNQVMQQQTQFTANFNEPIMVTPGTTTFYGQTMNHGMIGGQGALLSPPSSSSPESSFSPASSHSHALSPHTSVASPYSTSSHVSSPPHHQQYAPMSFPSGPYNGQQHNMVQHHQQNNRHNQGLHQSHQRQHQVPPPAYDEAVYGSNDQVTTFFNMGFPQQVYGQANYHSDQAYLTPSPDSPENGAAYSPDPEPAPLIDWTSHESSSGNQGGGEMPLLKPSGPSAQSVFI